MAKIFLFWVLCCIYTVGMHAATGEEIQASRRQAELFRIVKVIAESVEKMKRVNVSHAYKAALSQFTEFINELHENEENESVTEETFLTLRETYTKMTAWTETCRTSVDNQLSQEAFDVLMQDYKSQFREKINQNVIDVVTADYRKNYTTHTVGASVDCFFCETAELLLCLPCWPYPSSRSYGCGVGTVRKALGKKSLAVQVYEGKEEGGERDCCDCGLFFSLFSAEMRKGYRQEPQKGREWGCLAVLYRNVSDWDLDLLSCGVGPGCVCPRHSVPQKNETRDPMIPSPFFNWKSGISTSKCHTSCCGALLGYDVPWILDQLGIGTPIAWKPKRIRHSTGVPSGKKKEG